MSDLPYSFVLFNTRGVSCCLPSMFPGLTKRTARMLQMPQKTESDDKFNAEDHQKENVGDPTELPRSFEG